MLVHFSSVIQLRRSVASLGLPLVGIFEFAMILVELARSEIQL